MMTEHRAGTYVYNDVMMVHSGVATWDDCAMHVRTTVVSRPTADRAIVDTGSKVLTREQYTSKNFGRSSNTPTPSSSTSRRSTASSTSRPAARPKVGDVVNIIPNHCCVVSNMVDEVHGAARATGSRPSSPSPPAARFGESIELKKGGKRCNHGRRRRFSAGPR